MDLRFYKAQSTVKPNPIDVHADAAYIHKNITESNENGIIFYYYDEAKLTIEEFNAYANQNLINAQSENTDNQLTIMEAFADLYETIALNL